MSNDTTSERKEYTNGEVTVVWQSHICIHSARCFHGLPQVFDPGKRPWINATGATTQEITAQVSKCPSGALSFFMNEAQPQPQSVTSSQEVIVEVVPQGPILVYGNLTIKHKDGSEAKAHKVTAFCRCGASSNKPFCDGTHKKIDFQG